MLSQTVSPLERQRKQIDVPNNTSRIPGHQKQGSNKHLTSFPTSPDRPEYSTMQVQNNGNHKTTDIRSLNISILTSIEQS